jgi:hypothetical protein
MRACRNAAATDELSCAWAAADIKIKPIADQSRAIDCLLIAQGMDAARAFAVALTL